MTNYTLIVNCTSKYYYSTTLYCNHSIMWIPFTFMWLDVILCSTLEVQRISLTKYTIVNRSTVIVCKLNTLCVNIFNIDVSHWTSLLICQHLHLLYFWYSNVSSYFLLLHNFFCFSIQWCCEIGETWSWETKKWTYC